MTFLKRVAHLLFALVVVLVSVIPASAAESYYSIIPEQTVSFNTASGVNSGWQTTTVEIPSDVLSMPITLVVDGRSYSGYFSESEGSYYFGNLFLGFSACPDTGEDYFVGYQPGVRLGVALRGLVQSAVIELYAGTKPADSETVSMLDDFGTVAGAVMGFVATIADTIVSTPLLLLTVGFFFGGGCVGIFGRILSKN